MTEDADAAREYERLRGELADFVLDVLAERIAAGQHPELSKALVEAIDRRVDEAVAARLASAEWPDPDAFADSVIAAAAGRGTSRPASARATGGRRAAPSPASGLGRGKIALIALVGIVLVAAATFFLLRGWNAGTTNTVVMNAQTIRPEPLPGDNAQAPPANGAAPANLVNPAGGAP